MKNLTTTETLIHLRLTQSMQTEAGYIAEIQKLIGVCCQWRRDNPLSQPKVQFNYPEKVFLCATVPGALEKHFISADADGMNLLNTLMAACDGVSVAMVRCAIEIAFENKRF